MATVKAILERLGFLNFLATIFVVECDFDDRLGRPCRKLPMMCFLHHEGNHFLS